MTGDGWIHGNTSPENNIKNLLHEEINDLTRSKFCTWPDALLAFCERNAPATGELPPKGSQHVFFSFHPNKWLNKQSRCDVINYMSWIINIQQYHSHKIPHLSADYLCMKLINRTKRRPWLSNYDQSLSPKYVFRVSDLKTKWSWPLKYHAMLRVQIFM